jgi:cobalt-precorrin-7 (C5)-methyltransferase
MIDSKTHISICGIGPGSPDYILPAVNKEVDKADILIGGRRQLSIFAGSGKENCLFDGKRDNLKKSIEKHMNKHIAVLVSGDTGFHSLRHIITEVIPQASIDVFPGISSFQYFYAKLGMGYEKAFLTSMHGTETDYIEKLQTHLSVFLLTDRKNNYRSIARNLSENGFGNLIMHIGNNLSYPDEQIIHTSADEACHLNYEFSLCSVVIENKEAK